MSTNQKEEKSFTCSHGKGKVEGGKCSVRKSKNMCPKGHPCKRV
jgi:hypothetical protein